ncbi:MAG: nitroreductase family protein [Phycisphaerales bacterium]|jgi:nitroreductase|nr:nitroreductase family protein [Phycisphaerales bacterium]
MNPVIKQMHDHRSIRSYADATVPDDDIRAAFEAAQCAATSANIQVYSVLRVTRTEARQRLVELSGGQQKVADAGAFLVICGDIRRHRLLADRAGEPCIENLESFLLCAVDASLFAQNLVLALESLGWGTCYIGGIRNDLAGVSQLLELPKGVYPLYGLCVGKPDEAPWKRPRLPMEAVLFDDRYPSDEAMLEIMDRYDDDMAAYYEKRGASGRRWISQMESFFASPRRTGDRTYFESQGASLK